MQRLPATVLQALQQQREGEEESEGGGSEGPRRGRGRRNSRAPSEAQQTPFPITESSAYSSAPSPSPPLFSDAAGYPRYSGSQVRRGRRRGTGEDYVTTPPAVEVEARLRPAAGPRALGALSRPPTAKTLPPQLLGGRAETDADLLSSDYRDFGIDSSAAPAKPRTSLAVESLRPFLSPYWASRFVFQRGLGWSLLITLT